MEIFKAAAQPLDASLSVSNTRGSDVRDVEKSEIQANLVEKENEDLSKLSPDELTKKMKEATDELNYQMQQLNTNVRFAYNSQESTMVVQVREASTGDLIRELPTKEALRIARYFRESIGLLFDKES
ncbi:FlaG family protein [Campylobacter gastrosuis]|uniref:FlaG family protein n=1 Tax=Campylobacter gastrosuis TaxID=2974576 RepID=A0ABT7HNG3_9BACT|nr:FlaG family protein [Campylobacter gastrosuis]MDL0088374.1 FlaG family protein [Campylobacter gastrosuis]